MTVNSAKGRRAAWTLAVAVAVWSGPAAADDFESGSYIIPMDLDYQDEGMLRAYGLVYELLRNGVPVRWTIRTGKGYGEDDFTASAMDVATGAPVADHAYRGGPYVVDAGNAPEAADIIMAWQAMYPETAVHEATEGFSAEVARYLVVAPTIAMVADGNEDIARGYMQAAGIPDSTLSLDWAADSPDMLDIDELSGATEDDHRDGSLFDADGDPVYCQLMSMHWGVGDSENNPEVVAEVREYLNNPVHFFAECQAVNAFENNVNGLFLTPNGFLIGQGPDLLDYLHMDSPYGQIDGVFETVGGSEQAYTLPPGDMYKAGDIVMLTEAGTPVGVNDVWMTGYLDGACPPSALECGTIGKVSYLGGHEFSTTMPISANPDAQGVRMFLNSMFEAPCATLDGLPTVGVAVDAPEQTAVPTVTLSITYNNTSFATALDAVIVDELAPGVTFVSASNGGVFAGGTVTWDVANLGPGESGDLTIDVELADYGIYPNAARLEYRVGLNAFSLPSNVSQTEYGEGLGSTGGVDDTAGSGGGTGGGSGAGSGLDDTGGSGAADATRGTLTDSETAGQAEDPPSGCGCRSSTGGPGAGMLLLSGLFALCARRRRRLALASTGVLALATGCPGEERAITSPRGLP